MGHRFVTFRRNAVKLSIMESCAVCLGRGRWGNDRSENSTTVNGSVSRNCRQTAVVRCSPAANRRVLRWQEWTLNQANAAEELAVSWNFRRFPADPGQDDVTRRAFGRSLLRFVYFIYLFKPRWNRAFLAAAITEKLGGILWRVKSNNTLQDAL